MQHRRRVRLRTGRSDLLTATTAVANPIGPPVVLCGAGYQCVCGSGGVPVVDARLEEERDAKEQLSRLERMDMNSQEFLNELIVFRDEVIDHAQHEENEEFNQLQGELDPDDLKRMASAVLAAQAIAPTRPHPGVESAKHNVVVGPFASMLDRARDIISAALT